MRVTAGEQILSSGRGDLWPSHIENSALVLNQTLRSEIDPTSPCHNSPLIAPNSIGDSVDLFRGKRTRLGNSMKSV